ncbi:hypothetical protein [Solimonas variicoloris]|uniref:hypothetical protein n=1 Tax=Solimonas variicoloris TaxID=254408 RepID=UPI00038096DC|nr:hypothetical protein [Solimonas variicoloris]
MPEPIAPNEKTAAALRGLISPDSLTAAEKLDFLDQMAVPGEELERHVERLVASGHAIGYDDNDELVKSVPGGMTKPI